MQLHLISLLASSGDDEMVSQNSEVPDIVTSNNGALSYSYTV